MNSRLRWAALLTWGFPNFFWRIVLRRPAMAPALSLILVEALIVLSRFKFEILKMTASFFDFLIVDADTVAFLLTIFPDLRMTVMVAVFLAVPVLILMRFDPFRVRLRGNRSRATTTSPTSLARAYFPFSSL